MRLGKYKSLRAMLDQEFDADHYMDDNEVVDGNSILAPTVAYLNSVRPGYLLIEYCDGRWSKEVPVEGSGPEAHETPKGSA